MEIVKGIINIIMYTSMVAVSTLMIYDANTCMAALSVHILIVAAGFAAHCIIEYYERSKQ